MTIQLTDEDRTALNSLREFEEVRVQMTFSADAEPTIEWVAQHLVALDEDGEFFTATGDSAAEALKLLRADIERRSDREWSESLAEGAALLDERLAGR